MFTITPDDFPPKNKKWVRLGANSLRTDDIEGAQPHLPGYEYSKKPDLYNVNDIEKASPSRMHRESNKPNYSLQTSDILNASPNSVLFKTNRKGHNPLSPVYILPSYQVNPSTPPKFIRDHISVDDIEGSKPQIYSKWQTRKTMDISDINNSYPKKVLNKPNLMNPKDINSIDIFESNRKTNPLMPEYLCRDQDNNLVTVGVVEGSSPRKLIKGSQSPHNRHLDTKDIDGASTGTVGVGPIGTKLRNYIRSPTDTLDIEGAQSGSFKKGISTVRVTNPLDPKYTWTTEDPQEVKKLSETVINDKYYLKNHARFWGSTPPVSQTSTRKPSKPSTPYDHNYLRNAKKFYGQEAATPNTLQLDFNKNAEKFFSSTGKVHHISFIPAGSIHKPKKPTKNIDFDSESYEKNKSKFFYAYSPSNQSKRSEIDPEFEHASENSKRTSQSIKSNDRDYKFSLSRAEIAKPSEKSLNNLMPDSGTSQRKALSAVGKQFISS
jgi:hypothetical protein